MHLKRIKELYSSLYGRFFHIRPIYHLRIARKEPQKESFNRNTIDLDLNGISHLKPIESPSFKNKFIFKTKEKITPSISYLSDLCSDNINLANDKKKQNHVMKDNPSKSNFCDLKSIKYSNLRSNKTLSEEEKKQKELLRKEKKKIYNQDYHNRAEVRERVKKRNRLYYHQKLKNDPEKVRKRKEYKKIYNKKPEVKEKTSQYKKEYRNRPEVKEHNKSYFRKYYQEHKKLKKTPPPIKNNL